MYKKMVREYTGEGGEDDFWKKLDADLQTLDKANMEKRLTWKAKSTSKKNKELILSPEDEKEIRKLHSQKVSTIQEIPARYQRRIRESLNRKRKQHNAKIHKITRDEINPLHASYDEKYAKLIIDCFNDAIARKVTDFHNKKVYAHELWKIKDYTPKQLKRKMNEIPREVQAEIIKSLDLDPGKISSYKSEIKKQIIATFNTHY
jgi:hypothetical protein